MNFTSEIRRELLREPPKERCCALSMLSAFLTAGGSFREDGFSFTSENEDVAEFFLSIVQEVFGVSLTLSEATKDPKHGRDKLTFSYTGEKSKAFYTELKRAARNAKKSPCYTRAYLRGAFFGGGSCTLPREGAKTGYHLEFVFRTQEDLSAFRRVFEGATLAARTLKRGETFVAYCKSKEEICDYLAAIEAFSAFGKLQSVAAERAESNNRNRVENCTGSNADRSATASAAQILALGKLKERGALEGLPAPLRETAEARLSHPTLSLTELSALLGVTKGGLNHRLRRLMRLYEGDHS